MPKHLLETLVRPSPGFREAATIRFDDGPTSRPKESAGAIYLWGYAAEMTIKGAYFAALGFDENWVITFKDPRAHASPDDSWRVEGTVVRPGPNCSARYALAPCSRPVIRRPGLVLPWSRSRVAYHGNGAYEYETLQVRTRDIFLSRSSIL